MMDDGSAPSCVDDYNLREFECTGGEDEEKDKEMHEKFVEHYKSLSEEEQNGVKDCIKEVAEAVMQEVEITDECREEARKIDSKMTGE
ncbi:hypothetical protein HNY73_018126 [Argiope bruennichi]|uniref:Uncharacterized protein n=1 Tax=Argiope bruennichi TaxID=94029 RepID=A0A8T0ED96_ARGBR|nr:hypothetical protein HNY73_018126 [Argiope bruennichi]